MTRQPTTDPECLFCRIVNNEIPASRIRESEHSLIIADIAPQAPAHFLVLPKRHAKDLAAFMKGENASSELADLFTQTIHLTEEKGLEPEGYRLVVNTGEDGGQTVAHLHIHLLAGRRMGWPPG
jgi:histidine triad (HIT) family protein